MINYINLYNLSSITLPSFLRKPVRIDWLNSINSPVYTDNNALYNTHTEDLFELNHTNQVKSLEHYLNNKIALTYPIYLTDANRIDKLYIYKTTEISDKVYIRKRGEFAENKYIYKSTEISTDSFDFIVNVSSLDVDKVPTIIQYVDRLKAFEKKYTIIYY